MVKSGISARKKILVVEDDPEILNVMNIMLGLEGYEVKFFLTGTRIIKNQMDLPDLYILDKFLPDVDGIRICQYLKSNPTTKHIPVIVISAMPSRNEALDVGAESFIEKPFKMHRFLNSVAEALKVNPKNKWFAV